MTDDFTEQKEFALRAMFSRVVPPIADDGFSKQVVLHVRRTVWKRRIVLFVALTLGLTLALPVIPELSHVGRGQFESALISLEQSQLLQRLRNLNGLLPLWESAQATSQELTHISQRFRGNSSTQQLLMFLMAALMIIVSFLVTRVSKD